MGSCQGRYCAPLLAALVAEATGEAVGEYSIFAPRPPTKPVSVASIARQKPIMPMPLSLDAPRAYGGAARTGTDLDLKTDVLVVGGGILGCAVAYYLAGAGVEVTLIERHDLGTHASGRNAGSLHVQIQSVFARRTDPVWVKGYDEQLPMFPLAVQTWRELAAELDDDIELKICGGLMVAETAEHMRFLEAKAKRERARGLSVEVLGRAELRDVAPYLSERILGAEYCPDEGKLNPALATPAVGRAAERHGARILRHTELLELKPTNGSFEARLSRGRIRCQQVVDAAGPWASQVASMVGVTIPVQCKTVQQVVTEPAAPFISHLVEHAERRLTMKQAAAGHVILGGGWPGANDPETGYPDVLPAAIEGSLGTSVQVAPRLAQLKLLRAWSGVNVEIDGKPALGPVPGVPGFSVAVTGTGYTLGPICAKCLAETLLGRTPSMDIEPYSMARFVDA
jgi:glycine/D-amino acid oxidase-like deaminating enzyme